MHIAGLIGAIKVSIERSYNEGYNKFFVEREQ